MNQTKKRLSIINLAISIADIETIQLQILKLSPLKSDRKIQEILRGLQAEEYAKTQALITAYIEAPTEEIVQRSSQEEVTPRDESEKAIIEEFDLFEIAPEEEEPNKELFDLHAFDEGREVQKKESIDYDALLNLDADEILPDNIDLDISQGTKDDFFDRSDYTVNTDIHTEIIPKDTFFDVEEEESQTKEAQDSSMETEKEKFFAEAEEEENQESDESCQYDPIPYIDQKFKNLHIQYPPVEESDETFASVNAWLLQISQQGYSDGEVEEMIGYLNKLSEADSKAEAAQLLLISGATKSKFAQFMLARALFKGDILKKNIPESFTLMHRLAMDESYPEAICDLAQFYEYGIGVEKDKNRAESLYREAMELGVKRAKAHYERFHNANKGLFGKFFGK
jgi:hypothetical protein